MSQPIKIPVLAFVGACALASVPSAYADEVSVHVAAGVSVDAGVHINLGAAVDVIEAGLDFGLRFASPPPPVRRPVAAVVVTEAVVPSYYVAETVYVEPQPVFVAPVARYQPPMKRWGIGAFAGSMDVNGQEVGSDIGLLGRYRISSAFSLEAELAKSQLSEGGRVDRRLGASILYDFAPERSLSPFVLAGAGFGQTDIGDGEFHAEQGYAELGAGLAYRLSSRFHFTADLRAGARETTQDVAYMSSAPVADFKQEEKYSRARLGALIYF